MFTPGAGLSAFASGSRRGRPSGAYKTYVEHVLAGQVKRLLDRTPAAYEMPRRLRAATMIAVASCVRFSPRAVAAATIAASVAVVAAGCGGGNNPPPIDPLGGTSQQEAGVVLSVPEASVPTCSVGAGGGVCACADEPLADDAPNLYFVLDRSGSMAEDDKWPTIIQVIGQIVVGLGPRAAVGAAVFPNPYGAASSGDLPAACASGVEVFAPRLGDVPAGTAGPTADDLLTTLGHISASGGTPTAATLLALAPRLQSLPGKTYVILATDGGPNCDSELTCTIADCQPNIDGDCPVAPSSCCTDTSSAANQMLANLNCLDAQATIAAVQTLAGDGIPVYVVGVPGSETYAQLLDELAQAGGTARIDDDGGAQYYAVSSTDQAAFLAALSKVAASITGSCTLTLDAVPPDPSLVNVFLDDQPVPQMGPDGWTLDGATVTLLGATCQQVIDGDVLDVRVVAGCPTVLK